MLYRILATILIVYLGLNAVWYLQSRFDQSDLDKAAEFISRFKPGGNQSRTLLESMAQSSGVLLQDIRCESRLVSRTQGTVYVTCSPLKQADVSREADEFQWIINLVSYRVMPNNQAARALIQAQEEKHDGGN